MPVRDLVVFGAESCFSVDVIETAARLDVKIFRSVVTGEAEWNYHGIEVESLELCAPDLAGHTCIVPWMTPGHRHNKTVLAEGLGLKLAEALVDPSAIVASTVSILNGSYLNAGVAIGGQAELRRSVFVNRNASIGHHAVLDEFSSIGPGATVCARTHIGSGTFIGAGSVIAPGIEVGSNAVVASGASVFRNVPANAVVAGNPAIVKKTGIPGHNGVGVGDGGRAK